jgi:hypothetical protein
MSTMNDRFNPGEPLKVGIDTTDTLQPGMLLAYKDDYALDASNGIDRTDNGNIRGDVDYIVEQPAFANMARCAGVISPAMNGNVTGNRQLEILPLHRPMRDIPVWTDQSIVKGDLLGFQPGTYYARKGHLLGPLCFRAIETQDRSTTPGTVAVDLIPNLRSDVSVADYHRNTRLVDTAGVMADLFQIDDDAGFSIVADGQGLLLTTGTSDNDAIGLHTPYWFKLELGKPLYFEVEFALVSAQAQDIVVGLHDDIGLAATVLSDANPPALAADYDGVVIHKAAAETTNYDAAASRTTTNEAEADVVAIDAAGTFTRLGFFYDGIAGDTNTNGTVYITQDGAIVAGKVLGTTPGAIPNADLAAMFYLKTSTAAAVIAEVKRFFCQQPV